MKSKYLFDLPRGYANLSRCGSTRYVFRVYFNLEIGWLDRDTGKVVTLQQVKDNMNSLTRKEKEKIEDFLKRCPDEKAMRIYWANYKLKRTHRRDILRLASDILSDEYSKIEQSIPKK